MMLLPKVSRSTMAAQTRGPVNVLVQPENDSRDRVSSSGADLEGGFEARDDLGVCHRADQQHHLDQARVPAASPSVLREAAQNASCAAVNVPAARARAGAVEPGKAPGLGLQLRLGRIDDTAVLEQVEEALSSRTVIDQAIGVLMGQQRCTVDEAFALLRQRSQSSNAKTFDEVGACVDGSYLGWSSGTPEMATCEAVRRGTA